MARLAGLGQGHDEQTQIQADVFPARLEDFALARPSQQKQTDGKGFRPVAFSSARMSRCASSRER